MACLNFDSQSDSDYDYDEFAEIPMAKPETKVEKSSESKFYVTSVRKFSQFYNLFWFPQQEKRCLLVLALTQYWQIVIDTNSSVGFKTLGIFMVVFIFFFQFYPSSSIYLLGNRDGMVSRIANELFSRSSDPYLSAIYVMRNAFDFDKSKPNSLSIYGNITDSFIQQYVLYKPKHLHNGNKLIEW